MIHIEEKAGVAAQISLNEFRRKKPNTSFPEAYTKEAYGAHNVFEIPSTAKPTYDRETQKLVVTFVKAKGVWSQVITVSALTKGEIDKQDDDKTLNKSQFVWWKAKVGILIVWEDVLAHLRANNPNQYAQLLARGEKDDFEFKQVVSWLIAMRPVIDIVAPTFGTKRAKLLNVWKLALAKDF